MKLVRRHGIYIQFLFHEIKFKSGGIQGTSNVWGSALWAIDAQLQGAWIGTSAINFSGIPQALCIYLTPKKILFICFFLRWPNPKRRWDRNCEGSTNVLRNDCNETHSKGKRPKSE
jgi:hypothetical protein